MWNLEAGISNLESLLLPTKWETHNLLSLSIFLWASIVHVQYLPRYLPTVVPGVPP